MRIIWSLLASLFLCAYSWAQVHTSNYEYGWVNLPKPNIPELLFRGGADPFSGGTYEIAYSLVDKNNAITSMSPVKTLNIPLDKENWSVIVDTPGLDKNNQAVGTIFWIRKTSPNVVYAYEPEWRPLGGLFGKNNNKSVVYPYLPIGGYQYNSMRGHIVHRAITWYLNQAWYKFEDSFWKKNSYLAAPATAPQAKAIHLPNVDFEMCYSFVGNTGETLSDTITIASLNGPPTANTYINISTNYQNLSNGIIGRYVYLRKKGTAQWHRQKPSKMKEESGPDAYLWQASTNIITLNNYEESGIGPANNPAQSYLAPVQKAIEAYNGNIIIDADQTIYCPIISPLNVPGGTRLSCRIGTTDGGKWKIKTSNTAPDFANNITGYPVRWPMWIENAYRTNLVGCNMESDSAEGGIYFTDTSNGGAQHMICERVEIHLYYPGYTVGIAQFWEAISSSTKNNHSASEIVLKDTNIGAKYPIVIEGYQSENWTSHNLIASSNGDYDSAIITLNNAGSANFLDRNALENARTMVALVNSSSMVLENVFLDGGMPNYFLVCNNSPYIKASFNKANHKTLSLSLLEYPSQSAEVVMMELEIRAVQIMDVDFAKLYPSIFNPRWDGTSLNAKLPVGSWNNLRMYRPISDAWKKSGYNNEFGVFQSYAKVWDGWSGNQQDAIPRPKTPLKQFNYNNGATDNVIIYGWPFPTLSPK